jgi:hypothetical protein
MIPLYQAHLYHRIAPIHPLRNTSHHVLTTRDNQSEYLFAKGFEAEASGFVSSGETSELP